MKEEKKEESLNAIGSSQRMSCNKVMKCVYFQTRMSLVSQSWDCFTVCKYKVCD